MILVLLFIGQNAYSWSHDKMLLDNGSRKVKVKLGNYVTIDMLGSDGKKQPDQYTIRGSVYEITDEYIVIETIRNIVESDTIPQKDFTRKLKRQGWEIDDFPYEYKRNCDVVIVKYDVGTLKKINYTEIHSLQVRNNSFENNFAYGLSIAGASALGAAPFTGMRSDRYHWPSFFSTISGGLAAIIAAYLVESSIGTWASEFQNYQREFK